MGMPKETNKEWKPNDKEKQEEKWIEEEQAANAQYWKIPACCDDDDGYNSAITPNEPVDSLSMGDKYLNTILATKSDEFIKSSVENLVPNPSESKDENGCDDSDSRMEEINLSFNPDDLVPPGIEDDDDDSKRDVLILKELPSNYSLSLPENELFYFDIPSFSRPPAKPPDGDTRILNIKIMGDISDQKVPILRLMITLVSNQEKYPDLLPHRGLEIFHPSECPMMIHGKNIPILDILLFHFYPLDQFKYGGNWVKLSDLKQALRGRHPMLINIFPEIRRLLPKDFILQVFISSASVGNHVKDKQEKDKIETKPDKNRKRRRARQCQSPVTDEKAEKEEIQTQWTNTGKS
uniref:Uncharacterized protein n=1 Tax=Tanacetum cinerariifolium TaxID=118510 RepID=A0A6L2M0A4_TANCI|nr:hypothetical protein [Tanacetum cinerariifolium]